MANLMFPAFDGSTNSKSHKKRDLKAEICSDKVFMYLPTKERLTIRNLESRYNRQWVELTALNDKLFLNL